LVGVAIFSIPTYLYAIRFREWRRAKQRNFNLKVGTIDATQLMDKFKEPGKEPIEIELETIHLKRAKGSFSVTHDSKESNFNWILEFRGTTLILSRTEGELEAEWVIEALESDYRRRYGVADILYPIATRDNGKVAHATVDEPQKFFEYLHLLKNFSYVQINNVASRRAKDLKKRMIGTAT